MIIALTVAVWWSEGEETWEGSQAGTANCSWRELDGSCSFCRVLVNNSESLLCVLKFPYHLN